MKKEDIAYTQKPYCHNCEVVYEVQSTSCEKCGYSFAYDFFLVDDRHVELQRFRAARSMYQYNVKMGNV